ncbi:hypothetical protein A2U01_0040546, partial [Trifolium medium]|nr:hypothetical protein [Trifolium medium]
VSDTDAVSTPPDSGRYDGDGAGRDEVHPYG